MVRPSTTFFPSKDLVRPSTSMANSDELPRSTEDSMTPAGRAISHAPLRRRPGREHRDGLAGREVGGLTLRGRLDEEDELGALLGAEDHGRRELGLGRDVGDA